MVFNQNKKIKNNLRERKSYYTDKQCEIILKRLTKKKLNEIVTRWHRTFLNLEIQKQQETDPAIKRCMETYLRSKMGCIAEFNNLIKETDVHE